MYSGNLKSDAGYKLGFHRSSSASSIKQRSSTVVIAQSRNVAFRGAIGGDLAIGHSCSCEVSVAVSCGVLGPTRAPCCADATAVPVSGALATSCAVRDLVHEMEGVDGRLSVAEGIQYHWQVRDWQTRELKKIEHCRDVPEFRLVVACDFGEPCLFHEILAFTLDIDFFRCIQFVAVITFVRSKCPKITLHNKNQS